MEICVEIYNLLNQTTFTAREGVFDISVYPMRKEFDMKIGYNVKPPEYAQPILHLLVHNWDYERCSL